MSPIVKQMLAAQVQAENDAKILAAYEAEFED